MLDEQFVAALHQPGCRPGDRDRGRGTRVHHGARRLPPQLSGDVAEGNEMRTTPAFAVEEETISSLP